MLEPVELLVEQAADEPSLLFLLFLLCLLFLQEDAGIREEGEDAVGKPEVEDAVGKPEVEDAVGKPAVAGLDSLSNHQ